MPAKGRAKISKASSFARAIILFKGKQRVELFGALKRWSTQDDLGREIVRNLNPLERFLPPSSMRVLLLAIQRARTLPLDRLALEYRNACNTQTRQGGVIRGAAPSPVGRVLERDTFVSFLFRSAPGFFRIKAYAADFVDRLLIGDKLSPREAGILMSQYSAWVTWNEIAGRDPFEFAADAFHLRASLGLDNRRRFDKALLLLVYTVPSGSSLVRPTVADAGLHSFFEPPPIGHDECGLTKTWPSKLAKMKTRAKPIPRPEAVHSPVPLSYLGAPPRLL